MASPRLLLPLVLLLTLSLLINFYLFRQRTEQNRVVEVVDGDTFQLRSGKRVRLLGVDAPEYNRCGGSEAKSLLKSLVQDQ